MERFDALGIVTDWGRFDRISSIRKEVEHYFTNANKKALEGLVSDAFVVTRNFIALSPRAVDDKGVYTN